MTGGGWPNRWPAKPWQGYYLWWCHVSQGEGWSFDAVVTWTCHTFQISAGATLEYHGCFFFLGGGYLHCCGYLTWQDAATTTTTTTTTSWCWHLLSGFCLSYFQTFCKLFFGCELKNPRDPVLLLDVVPVCSCDTCDIPWLKRWLIEELQSSWIKTGSDHGKVVSTVGWGCFCCWACR